MRIRLAVGVAVLALGCTAGAAGAEAFTAHGSVEQVYVTGADPGAKLSLVDRRGHTTATQQVNALGGLLFREVAPGSGYRVRPQAGGDPSAPLTVLNTRSAPPSTTGYDQEIPPSGY